MDQAVEKLGLNERDKAALQHANRKAMMYVFGGGWAGAMLGATFAFRYRFASYARAWGYSVPRPLAKGLVLYDAAAADAATASVYMRRLFFRGFVWSLFGGILGSVSPIPRMQKLKDQLKVASGHFVRSQSGDWHHS